MKFTLGSRLTAEFIGTAFLVAAVVGSGVMGEKLAGGNVAIALLANTIATGAALVALILAFGAISGAHFNPVVTLAEAIDGGLTRKDASAYVAVQIVGGIAGAITAHLMFGLSVVSISLRARPGWSLALSEFVATFGLLLVIFGCSRQRASAVPFAVAAYITARSPTQQSQSHVRSPTLLQGFGPLMSRCSSLPRSSVDWLRPSSFAVSSPPRKRRRCAQL
jgi:glycerol uptake facilitator-like aquaporin